MIGGPPYLFRIGDGLLFIGFPLPLKLRLKVAWQRLWQ